MPRPRSVLLLAALLSACASGSAGADAPSTAASEVVTLEGTLHVVFGDGPNFFLTDETGTTVALDLSEDLLRQGGGTQALQGRSVRVGGAWVEPNRRFRVEFLERAE